MLSGSSTSSSPVSGPPVQVTCGRRHRAAFFCTVAVQPLTASGVATVSFGDAGKTSSTFTVPRRCLLVRNVQRRGDDPVGADLAVALDLDVCERGPCHQRDHPGHDGADNRQLADHDAPCLSVVLRVDRAPSSWRDASSTSFTTAFTVSFQSPANGTVNPADV